MAHGNLLIGWLIHTPKARVTLAITTFVARTLKWWCWHCLEVNQGILKEAGGPVSLTAPLPLRVYPLPSTHRHRAVADQRPLSGPGEPRAGLPALLTVASSLGTLCGEQDTRGAGWALSTRHSSSAARVHHELLGRWAASSARANFPFSFWISDPIVWLILIQLL